MNNKKKIYLLIGQKGSGKSYIGNIFNNHGVRFIRVEDWAKEIKQDREIDNEIYLMQVFDAIECGIRNSLNVYDRIVFESTGLTQYFDSMLENLIRDFSVTTIGIRADSSICLERVKARDQSVHINVSDEQVLMINQKVAERGLETDFTIENIDKSIEALEIEIERIIEKS